MLRFLVLVFIFLSLFFIQGCTQKKLEPTVKNIEFLEKKIEEYVNKKYKKELGQTFTQAKDYDLEFIHTQTKTVAFIKYKNNILFCNKQGCSAEMLEYTNEVLESRDSFMLTEFGLYLLHDFNAYGFSQIVVPMIYKSKEGKFQISYNLYEPFTQKENEILYPNTKKYIQIQEKLRDRKKSIKFFEEMEN